MRFFRRMRDLALLLAVVIYSGAHMPTSHGLAHISQSFADGYQRGYDKAHDKQK